MTIAEVAANLFNALAIFLAGRNHVHTWTTSIIGCVLFGYVFYGARLYADVTLQGFFIVASVFGWWQWRHGRTGDDLPVQFSTPRLLALSSVTAIIVAMVYGWLLYRFTDAYAPYVDSILLAFSVLGQLLLVYRRVENWWCWILVNTIAVPLYWSRGLQLTAVLYAAFWINAIVSLIRWRRLAVRDTV